jgi:large subunit ribosomal protein L24e
MPKCTFCGNQIERGMGKMFIYNNGKIDHYCSNKCEKNYTKLNRKPLRVKWTEAYRKEKQAGNRGREKSAGKTEPAPAAQ